MADNTANNLDEFNAQARSFVAKAKAKGMSNTAMANTIKFMYGTFLESEKNKITPYQQAMLDLEKGKVEKRNTQLATDKDGNPVVIDMNTGEVVNTIGTTGDGNDGNTLLDIYNKGDEKETVTEESSVEDNIITTASIGQPGADGTFNSGMSTDIGPDQRVVWNTDVSNIASQPASQQMSSQAIPQMSQAPTKPWSYDDSNNLLSQIQKSIDFRK